MKIIGLIPARGGSKGIPKKNIKEYCGKPLIAHTIHQSLNSKYLNEIFVSTDSQEIQEIAIRYGAEAPFLRPESLSGDLATDKEFINHFINWYQNNNGVIPDIIVHLRPTYPNRDVNVIDDIIEKFVSNYDKYDSVRTIVEVDKSPYKMYRIKDKVLQPLFKEVDGISEPYNQPRQILPKTYLHNGYLDIIKTDVLIKKDTISGDRIMPYILDKEEIDDIDTIEDWEKSEKKFWENKY